MPRKNRPKKLSFGIICITRTKGEYKFLLVKKRYTYAYFSFVYGKYKHDDDEYLMNLFNNMTVEEKLDILSLNFLQSWYRIHARKPSNKEQYLKAQNKFEMTFMTDGGKRLRELISNSKSIDLLWELPKGRRRSWDESAIYCAMREFEEETGISKNQYTIFPETETYSFVDNGVLYKYIYYLAYAPYELKPFIKFDYAEQISEIVSAKWFTLKTVIDTKLVPFLHRVLRRFREKKRSRARHYRVPVNHSVNSLRRCYPRTREDIVSAIPSSARSRPIRDPEQENSSVL